LRRSRAENEAVEAEEHAKDLGISTDNDLQNMILSRQKQRGDDLLAKLEAKYTQPKKKKSKKN
jgi:hypothetical protein